jgi:NADH:ubiquinone oxidoreductase subunit F (NADH-binding)
MTASVQRKPPTGVGRLLADVGGSPSLRRHLEVFGPLDTGFDVLQLAEAAGLRGRGGAGFPTARKLAAAASRRGDACVVANGAEGEPTSRKDRSLLRVAPHLVLDGAVLAARAIGAEDILVAVSRPAPELERAIAERRGRASSARVEVRRVPDAFVAGEETALVRALEGRSAKPTLKPPYPFECGVDGRPTLVQNVETLAHLALIARYGPSWFGGGTALVTLGGAFVRRGVHEIPIGATLEDVVRRLGGESARVQAYLVGGYFGTWVRPTDAADVALTPEVLGAGAIVALPQSTCALAECNRVVRYLASESAGQCGPCVHGLGAIADAFAASRVPRSNIQRWANMVDGRGACRHPDGAARFVRSALDVFADEFDRHVRHGGCGRPCKCVLPVGAGP